MHRMVLFFYKILFMCQNLFKNKFFQRFPAYFRGFSGKLPTNRKERWSYQMNAELFAMGVVAGLAGAAAAAVAVSCCPAKADWGRSVSRTAHHTAGMVSRAAHEAANTVDRMVD